jgi:hypothetical protein
MSSQAGCHLTPTSYSSNCCLKTQQLFYYYSYVRLLRSSYDTLSYCLGTGVFKEPFPSNDCLFWLHSCGFQQMWSASGCLHVCNYTCQAKQALPFLISLSGLYSVYRLLPSVSLLVSSSLRNAVPLQEWTHILMQMLVFGSCHYQPLFNVSVSVLILMQAANCETAVSNVNQNMELTGSGFNVGSVHIYSIILITLHCWQFVMTFFPSSP